MGTGRPEFPIRKGKEFSMSGREFEVDRVIPPADFISGACFGHATPFNLPQATVTSSSVVSKPFLPPHRNPDLANKMLSVSNRKVVPLQPVNLASSNELIPDILLRAEQVNDSHWTCYWCSLPIMAAYGLLNFV
jgi:hypothetical protein